MTSSKLVRDFVSRNRFGKIQKLRVRKTSEADINALKLLDNIYITFRKGNAWLSTEI